MAHNRDFVATVNRGFRPSASTNGNVIQRTPSPASSNSTYIPAASEVGSTGTLYNY